MRLNFKTILLSILFMIQYKIGVSIITLDSLKIKTECNIINHKWIEQDLILTKNCVGYSAPVAARTFNYISIGIYESIIDFIPNQKSLSGQLIDFNRITWNTNRLELNFPFILNEVNHQLTLFFYKNMPPKNLIEVDS